MVLKMNERDKAICIEVFCGETFEAAGGMQGVTRARATQIVKKAVESLAPDIAEQTQGLSRRVRKPGKKRIDIWREHKERLIQLINDA